jgi:hypothetical protein
MGFFPLKDADPRVRGREMGVFFFFFFFFSLSRGCWNYGSRGRKEHFVLSLMLGGVRVNCVYRVGQLWGQWADYSTKFDQG